MRTHGIAAAAFGAGVVLLASSSQLHHIPARDAHARLELRARPGYEEKSDAPPPGFLSSRWGGFPHAKTTTRKAAVSAAAPASNWVSLGPRDMLDADSNFAYEPSLGRLNAVAIDPTNSNHIFVGAGSGGVWESTDGGQNWTPRTDHLPVLGVSDIEFDPQNPSVLYLATGDCDAAATPSIGVYKSTDGGVTWNPTGLAFPYTDFKRIFRLAMHPTDSGRIYAATNDGVYITSNAGANWQRVNPDGRPTPFFCYDVKLRPGNPAVVYAVGRFSDFYRSPDNGATWERITAGLPDPSPIERSVIGVTAVDANVVYLLASNGNGTLNGLYRSTNGGSSFGLTPGTSQAAPGFGNQGNYDIAIAVSPTNASEVYIGGVLPLRSTNAGSNWQTIRGDEVPFTPGQSICHVDVHDLQFAGGALFAATDGGLHRSIDGGVHWTDLSQKLVTAQIYYLSTVDIAPNLIYAGEQDNGMNRLVNGKWEHVRPGDFGHIVVHPKSTNLVFASSNSGLMKTVDGFKNFFIPLTITNEPSLFPGPAVAVDPTDLQIAYSGFRNIFKSTDFGDNWQPVTSYTDSAIVAAIEVAPSNPNVVYASRPYGGVSSVVRTPDGGATWKNIAAGLPDLPVSDFAIDPANPDRVWVSLIGGTDAVVYRTENGGDTWTNYSGTLPNIAAQTITYQKGSADAVYVGMSAGVYYRDASMSDWEPFMSGLPNVIVNDLQFNYAAGKLRAATYGRGIWQTDIPSGPAQPPGQLLNISTRLAVQTGDNVLIAGFIISSPTGAAKKVLIRGLGPSLPVGGALADPILELNKADGTTQQNDDWKQSQQAEIQATTIPPSNDLESAIVATLPPGAHTAILRGLNNGTGIGLIEVYDLESANGTLANISTRGLVQSGDGAMIGGLIIGGNNGARRVIVRAIGPSLGIAGQLQDPALELFDGNGNRLQSNNNWKDTQQAEIQATTIAPSNDLESAIVASLAPAAYTAVVRGVNDTTGVALVEVYALQ